ncbi:MAG: efflux RND transporter periplasmic adaptor subunit [bacterium]
MKKILIAIIIIVIIGVILRLTLVKKETRTTTERIALSVEVAPVKKTDVKRTCSLIGTLIADKTVQVFPETMGRVTRILIKEGSYVNKGDKLIAMKNETIGFEFEEAYVTAPISGTVAKILVDIGSTVAPQMPVLMLVDVSKIKVSFNAPESDAQCFRLNMPVSVSVDAIPDKNFTGYITEISPVVDAMTKTIAVKASLERQGSALKPGMTARVSINLGERKNVIAISQDALIDKSVFVVKNDSTVEKRVIKTGFIGDETIEILDGLKENELIVVLGQQRLAGGEKVIPIVREK